MERSNKVLEGQGKASSNFYESDLILRDVVMKILSEDARSFFSDNLLLMGREAAGRMNEYSLNADRHPPVYVPRDHYGETIEEIRFHPHYGELMKIAVKSDMFRIKWEPALRKRFGGERNAMSFAVSFLYAMSESGQYCPLCMTDGVALIIDKYAEAEDKERLLSAIYTDDPDNFHTGAMFLTEKAGGSDVGANLTQAFHQEGKYYTLHGEKWFCSNVNAEIILALARTPRAAPGTRGLSIFLIEKNKPSGERNFLGIVRLKDKLGVRSMASAECVMDGTIGKLLGEESQGFPIMSDMINLSRLYNSVAAVAAARRALAEAWQFLNARISFSRKAVEHALVRKKLWELGAVSLANMLLLWKTIETLDKVESGDSDAAHLLRILTPILKKVTAEESVYVVRESMELMGGLGYIEDTVMPKLMRDVMVLPIWEGAGNIMVLDMLRSAAKSDGLKTLSEHFAELKAKGDEEAVRIADAGVELIDRISKLVTLEKDEMEFNADGLFTKLVYWYKLSLLYEAREFMPSQRIDTAVNWFRQILQDLPSYSDCPNENNLQTLVGWEV